jgi:hypothetical protein
MGSALAVRAEISAEEPQRPARLEAQGRITSRMLARADTLDVISRERAAESLGPRPVLQMRGLSGETHRLLPLRDRQILRALHALLRTSASGIGSIVC